MKVCCARTAGFCMGVSLALKTLDMAINAGHSGRLVMFGPIIHNPQVLKSYAEQGVLCIEKPDELFPGDTVIIRAHGIPRMIEDQLKARGAVIVDATCPRVKAAQNAIARATADGARLLLFGEAEHPEVRGLVSYAQGDWDVFLDPTYVKNMPLGPNEPVVLASQTTQAKRTFEEVAAVLGARTDTMILLSTVCDATARRQREALALADQCDVVVVIGGRTSGNTRRLADVVASTGTPVYLVETAADLPEALRGVGSVGVTAGASTPADIIDEVCQRLDRYSK